MSSMKIAVPMAAGKMCMHFGHCEVFTLIDVDQETHEILSRENLTPPPHEPGLLPRWLAEQGVELVLAGGMGQRAQALFMEHNIKVVVGLSPDDPERMAKAWLGGVLRLGENPCDH